MFSSRDFFLYFGVSIVLNLEWSYASEDHAIELNNLSRNSENLVMSNF